MTKPDKDLQEAIDQTLDNTDLTINPPTNGNAKQQVLIRATEEEHQNWKTAANHLGISMSEYIRSCANTRATELLDCQHPINSRRWYPWAEFCLKCGQRLRNGRTDGKR